MQMKGAAAQPCQNCNACDAEICKSQISRPGQPACTYGAFFEDEKPPIANQRFAICPSAVRFWRCRDEGRPASKIDTPAARRTKGLARKGPGVEMMAQITIASMMALRREARS